MSTFIQLCQDVTRESGTLSGTVPTTVVGQAGRLLHVVNWVAEAWRQIQALHTNWRWMATTYSYSSLTSGTATYTPASFGITDLREWRRDNISSGYHPHTIYLTATGVSDERPLSEMSWEAWRTKYGRGSQTNNYPYEYAITPAGSIAFGPTPDASYTVRGEYYKTPTVMTLDADTPAAPGHHHQVIVRRALMMMAEYDEDLVGYAASSKQYRALLDALESDEIDTVFIAHEPLA